jgi:hypothetical protein
MTVRMTLQIDQQPIGRLMRQIPLMPRQDMLIDTVTQMFARQPVVRNIVDQFQLPDSNKSLKSKEQPPCKTVNAKSQNYKANLQYNISQ